MYISVMEFYATMIPVAVAASIAIFIETRKKSLFGVMVLSLLAVLILARFLTIALEFNGDVPDKTAVLVESFCAMYIIPLMYIYLCDQCGTHWKNRETIFMSTIPIAGLYAPELSPAIVVINCLTVALCMNRLRLRMKEYHLKFSKEMFIFFTWMFTVLGFSIFAFATNMHESQDVVTKWVFFFTNSLLITVGFLYIPRSFNVRPVIDEDSGKRVSVDSFVDSHTHLAQNLDALMIDEEIFLKPGITIDDIAVMLGSNRVYVSRLMSSKYGTTFTDYINQSRIEFAKNLMASTEKSIEDIAIESGFQSSSSFCRVFKKVTDETPSAWRSRNSR